MTRTTVPAFDQSGRLLAAGEASILKRAEVSTSGPVDSIGAPLVAPRARPPRPCARCARRFKPTRTRWVLCKSCFTSSSATVE